MSTSLACPVTLFLHIRLIQPSLQSTGFKFRLSGVSGDGGEQQHKVKAKEKLTLLGDLELATALLRYAWASASIHLQSRWSKPFPSPPLPFPCTSPAIPFFSLRLPSHPFPPPGWRCGSVVRTSVCSRRTFPDLRLIHGWRVTTLWVRRPLWVNQLGQLSLPSLLGR